MNTSSKTFLQIVTGISLVLLAIVCFTLLAIAWTSMNTIERLEQENRRLLLANNACNIRLENAGVKSNESVRPIELTKPNIIYPQAPVRNVAPTVDVNKVAPTSQIATNTPPVIQTVSEKQSEAPLPQAVVATESTKTPINSSIKPSESTENTSANVDTKEIQTLAQHQSNEVDTIKSSVQSKTRNATWYVQLGAFSYKKHANMGLAYWQKELQQNYPDVALRISKSRKYYKILTTVAMTKSEALKLAAAIRGNTSLETIVVRQKK